MMYETEPNFSPPERFKNAHIDNIAPDIVEYIRKVSETSKGLYISGDVGRGKTYAIFALMNRAQELGMYRWRAWSSAELFADIRATFNRSKDSEDPVEKAKTAMVLIIDDLGAEKMSEWVETQLGEIIDYRYAEMKPMIFTSNLSIDKLAERVGDRIVSRILGSCNIVELTGVDRRINGE